MKIPIDWEIAEDGTIHGIHYFEFGVGVPNTLSPVDKASGVSPTQLLALLSANAGIRASSGWNVPTKLPGYPPGTTRYDVLRLEAAKANADPALKALNLQP